jgi:hypothetical protein
MKQVLIIQTAQCDLRSATDGWTHEDPSLYVKGKEIGYTPTPWTQKKYSCVFEALADGWELIGPPVFIHSANTSHFLDAWDWWLTKEF